MDALRALAETRIREAIARGEFDELPGRGRPLALEDLSAVPDDLRASYLVLKSTGWLPEELELRKELVTLRSLLAACTDPGDAAALRRDLRLRALRLAVLAEDRRRDAGSPAAGAWPPLAGWAPS